MLSFPHEAMDSERFRALPKASQPGSGRLYARFTLPQPLLLVEGMGDGAKCPARVGLFQSDTTCVHRNAHRNSQPGTPGGLEQLRPSTLHGERDGLQPPHQPPVPKLQPQGVPKPGACARAVQGWLCNHPVSQEPPFPDVMLPPHPRAPPSVSFCPLPLPHSDLHHHP